MGLGMSDIFSMKVDQPTLTALATNLQEINGKVKDGADKAAIRNQAGAIFENILEDQGNRIIFEAALKKTPELSNQMIKLTIENPDYVLKNMGRLRKKPEELEQIVAEGMKSSAPVAAAQKNPAEIKNFSEFMIALGEKAEAGNETAKLVQNRLQRETLRDAEGNQVRMMDRDPKMLVAILGGIDKNPNMSKTEFDRGWKFARNTPGQMYNFVSDPTEFVKKAETTPAKGAPKATPVSTAAAVPEDSKPQESVAATSSQTQGLTKPIADNEQGKKMEKPTETGQKKPSLMDQIAELTIDKERNMLPGFKGFLERVDENPALKSALESLGNDGNSKKADGFVAELKTQLENDPNLFVTVNNFIDKNQKNIGKIAREMADDPKGAFQKLHTATGLSKVGNWFRENVTWGGIGNWLGDLMDGLPGLLDIFKPILEFFGIKGLTTAAADKKPDTPAATTASNPASTPQNAPSAPTPSAAVLQAQEKAAIKEADARSARADTEKLRYEAEQAQIRKGMGTAQADTPAPPDSKFIEQPAPDAEELVSAGTRLSRSQYDVYMEHLEQRGPMNGQDMKPASAPVESQLGQVSIYYLRNNSTAYGALNPQKDGSLGSNASLGERGTLRDQAFTPVMKANTDPSNIAFGPPDLRQQPDNRPQQQQATYRPVQQVSVPT